MSDDEERADLITRAEKLGYHVIQDHTWGDVLWRHGEATTNPATHSNATLDDLREMLDGIEWGREHGTAES
jgi:hypothetical protein